jgi:long-chain fatty acid transport protein
VSGGDGGDAGGLYAALGTYLVVKTSEDYRLGLSVNSPFSYAVDYANDWAGRYFIEEWKLETVDIRPCFACRVDHNWTVGAGADVYYAYNSESAALNASSSGQPDGRYTNHADDWRLGFDVGALCELSPETRMGITYRSKVDFVMKSNASFQDPGLALGPALNDSRYDQKLQLPDNVDLSFYHDFSPRFALLCDVGWTNWSDFTHAPTTLDATPVSVPRNWHDTYRGGIGARYRFADHWLVQSGYSYDSSPVRDENRTPELPIDEQHRVSVGLQHDFSPHVTMGAAYTFAYLGAASIDRTLDPSSGHLQGQYSPDQVHVVSLSFNFGF